MDIKIKSLKNQMEASGFSGMIVSNPANIRYLTGLTAEGTLLITPKSIVFITDARYIESVNAFLTIEQEIIAYDMKKMSNYMYESFFEGCENVGFEEGYVTYEGYKSILSTYKVNLIESEHLIEKNRMVKEKEEIEACKKACLITDDCYDYVKEIIEPGMSEKELALEIEKFFKTHGADDIAFDTIVASGPNSSMPHAVPTDRIFEENDIIQLDMGCKVDGYCSDFSRVIFLGHVNDEQEKAYNFVLKQYEYILKNMKDGVYLKETLKQCENDYKEAGFELMHSFGHGLGLDIHEEPIISSKYDPKLKTNMLVTVEPGVYLPGKFGIRIEDTILINRDNGTPLTKSGKSIYAKKY